MGGQSGAGGRRSDALGEDAGSFIDVGRQDVGVLQGIPGAGGRPGPEYSCDSSQVATAFIRVTGQRPLIATLTATNCVDARCTPEADDVPCAVAHVASHINEVGPCMVRVGLTDGRSLLLSFKKVPNPNPMSYMGCTLRPFILDPPNVEIPAEPNDAGVGDTRSQ
ncbi:MAG: hypothetical protein SF187_20000 [Deltaproteobacteria bacterium]|nr:hypothetical protein [Deltaproteobacteria bacterium]